MSIDNRDSKTKNQLRTIKYTLNIYRKNINNVNSLLINFRLFSKLMINQTCNVTKMTKENKKLDKKTPPLSVGFAITVFVVFLIISGTCKLAFYALKAHRSAVSREPLVQAFVDIQPFSEEIKGNTDVVVYRDKNSNAPGIVFKKDKPQLANVTENTETIVKRPPVLIKQAAIVPVAPAVVEEESPFIDIDSAEIVDADTTPLPLEDMVASAKSLLDASDKQVTQTAMLLNDEEQKNALILTPETKNTDKPEITVARASIKENVAKFVKGGYNPYKGKFLTQNNVPAANKTWLNEEALRRQIAEEENQKFLANETVTAAVEVQHTDSVEKKTDLAQKDNLKTEDKKIIEPQKSLENNIVASQQETPAFKTADEIKELKEEQTKTSLSQKDSSPFLTPEEIKKLREAQNADNPWIVAKVGGKSPKNLAVKQTEQQKVEPKKQVYHSTNLNNDEVVLTKLSDEAEKSETSSSEIFRYDRKIEENDEANKTDSKSLNWMDREQAAVWTSLSQTDTPSVWEKKETEETSGSVKAFRVADELTADEKPKETTETNKKESDEKKNNESNEISSKTARVIEDKKHEGIKNPTLLPLPNETAKGLPAPVSPTGTSPVMTQNNSAPSIGLPQPSTTNGDPEKNQSLDKSLVNKIFSIFKTEDEQQPTSSTQTNSAQSAPQKGTSKMPTLGKGNTAKNVETSTTPKIIEKQIMPSEIRLTFKPDSTEISSQSVKWIKSFGQSVKADIQKAIEVRMSSTSPALQEKRFAIIRSILIGVGVDEVQIVPLLTDRTPHTIVLRTYQIPDEEVAEYTTSTDGIKASMYYKKW